MACYSMSCAIYSFCVEKLVKKFRAKPVYVGGQLVYCVGMIFMALTRTKWGVLFFSWSAGIMYSTLFTMPYIIVAHYHETNTVRKNMRLCIRLKMAKDTEPDQQYLLPYKLTSWSRM